MPVPEDPKHELAEPARKGSFSSWHLWLWGALIIGAAIAFGVVIIVR